MSEIKYVGKSTISHLINKIKAMFIKVDQGTNNSGKILTVGEDGTVSPKDIVINANYDESTRTLEFIGSSSTGSSSGTLSVSDDGNGNVVIG